MFKSIFQFSAWYFASYNSEGISPFIPIVSTETTTTKNFKVTRNVFLCFCWMHAWRGGFLSNKSTFGDYFFRPCVIALSEVGRQESKITRKQEKKKENKNATKKVIKKKIFFFLFLLVAFLVESVFSFFFFLVFLVAFLVEFLFSYFLVFFYKFPPQKKTF